MLGLNVNRPKAVEGGTSRLVRLYTRVIMRLFEHICGSIGTEAMAISIGKARSKRR
jgi:hypothetical protein